MEKIQVLTLLLVSAAAALADLRSGRIPNGLILAGLCMGLAYQLLAKGVMGIVLFLGGSLLPVLLFAALYYFRMIGAGDIKLLSTIGGFLGPEGSFGCIAAAVFIGGGLSLALMVRRGNALKRLDCFLGYAEDYARTGQWGSYLERTEESARFCFSVPVFLAVLAVIFRILYRGGT